MIDLFESSVRISPNATFFTFVDEDGTQLSYTYKQTRIVSAALARRLKRQGVRPGEMVVVDLPNCPEFVFTVLAAAYGGYTLVTLKHSLSEGEKIARVLELEHDDMRIGFQMDMARARELMPLVRNLTEDESVIIESIYGQSQRERAIMGQRQDIIDDTIHFAEREAHIFDSSNRASIMFTVGASGKSKAVVHTWDQLVGASISANESLAKRSNQLWQAKLPFGKSGQSGSTGEMSPSASGAMSSAASTTASKSANNTSGKNSISLTDNTDTQYDMLWQCVLPLYHIYGFQILVRSVAARTPIRIYKRFDAEEILHDCESSQVTHISVSDRMLQDLLTVEEWRQDVQPTSKSRLTAYQCILLSSHKLNPRTISRALSMGARVFAGYGTVETSSLIAASLVTPEFRGGLKLLEGYEARIVDPDDEGFGRLAVKGPGVFGGYLNASAAFTVDHFYITGDVAALYDGSIFVKDKTEGMFVCAGEDIYAEEVADVLRHVPGVSAAHVFGVADAKLGRRPIAVVERGRSDLTVDDIVQTALPWLSNSTVVLENIVLTDRLPRLESGKVDRAGTERMFRDRIQVQRIVLHHIRLPFRSPLQTAMGTLEHRDSVIVEVIDSIGRIGLGECVSFDAEWGLEELLPDDVVYIQQTLAPAVLGQVFLHPRSVSESFSQLPGALAHPMALSAVENALWDLFGQATEKPLWKLMREEYAAICTNLGIPQLAEMPTLARIDGNEAFVTSGAVIGLAPTPVAMENASAAVSAGYRRVKMNIAPGIGFASVQSVRRAFPDLLITLDANRSFTDATFDELKSYDALNIGWIEEPFDVSGGSTVSRRDPLVKISTMQNSLATPLCVDESYANAPEADRILSFPDIHCISIKASKFGSIEACLQFIAKAKAQGRVVCMGGMYDMGISRRVSAAFETLPDMVFPGDVGAIQRYFDTDITFPHYTARGGIVSLNVDGFEYGIGCMLDEEALSSVEVEQLVLE